MEKPPEFFDGFLNVKSELKLRNARSGAVFGAVGKVDFFDRKKVLLGLNLQNFERKNQKIRV